MALKTKDIMHELKHHLPLALLAATLGIILSLFLKTILIDFTKLDSSFETFHFIHIFASAIVSGGIFYRYKKKLIYALLIGTFSSVLIGSLSDIIFPFIGSLIFNLKTTFHFPLIESPLIIIGIGLFGSIIGISTGFTKLPHFAHVFISTIASLFYLLAFTPSITITVLAISFIVTLFAVLIPCCFSDIIFPFLFLNEKIKHCECK